MLYRIKIGFDLEISTIENLKKNVFKNKFTCTIQKKTYLKLCKYLQQLFTVLILSQFEQTNQINSCIVTNLFGI